MAYGDSTPWWFGPRHYFRLSYQKDNSAWSIYVRTPLFSVGYYRDWRHPHIYGLSTGLWILYIPTRWNLQLRSGELMYRRSWDRSYTRPYFEPAGKRGIGG